VTISLQQTCSFRRWSRGFHMHHKPSRDCFRQPEVSSGEWCCSHLLCYLHVVSKHTSAQSLNRYVQVCHLLALHSVKLLVVVQMGMLLTYVFEAACDLRCE